MMSLLSLFKWALESPYPVKVAALLSIFNPDEEELRNWTISYDDESKVCTINDSSYIILDYNDAEAFCESFRMVRESQIEEEAYEAISEEFRPYFTITDAINWEQYWKDNEGYDILTFRPELQKINFNQITYYYEELD